MRSSKLPPIGLYKLAHPEKYIGDHVPVFRSSWEHRVMYYFDNNPHIIRWGSEIVQVPYISPKDAKMHRYFVDFYAELVSEGGGKKKLLIEVKPKKQLEPPKTKNRSKKTILTETIQYAVNMAKFEAAKKFAQANGMIWDIYTEEDIEMHC